ncbi:hypothetical protein RHA1_ro00351 [Rhodococcus jostii RHA1]|uniref:Uncharacterized protein n=1 Tax=Rhodococcus jostii (strain RHA1) TaxID=101510 RepID=Q0SJU9_RHOJR|nr:hypothetical protein RHA1_ro00351 [Rhodococcus jostii RHA1]
MQCSRAQLISTCSRPRDTPEPSAETSDASRTYMTIDPPPGDTLTLGFDAYIQPSSQLGHSGSVSVSEKGVDVVTLEFTTWLVP